MTAAAKSGEAAPFYLDDLVVGQRFTSASHVVTEAEIKTFAAQFDPQPFHLDNEAAKTTLFGGLAASGWHTAAISMELLVKSGLPLAGGIIGTGGELNWLKPVRPGDTLTVVSEVLEITPSSSRPDRGLDPCAHRDAQSGWRSRANFHAHGLWCRAASRSPNPAIRAPSRRCHNRAKS